MQRIPFIVILFCFAGIALPGVSIPTPDVSTAPLKPQHQVFDTILRAVVNEDGIDYAALKNTYADKLDYYRKQIAAAQVPQAQAERMAFYINAYNALTLALVIKLLPNEQQEWESFSVRKQRGFWTAYTFEVAGTQMSLDHIEHKILRPMGDPRVHFAVNCASVSCPPLRSWPYTGAQLHKQLAEQTALFMDSPYHLRLNDDRLQINPILKWFGSDFKQAGGVRSYLIQHVRRPDIKDYLKAGGRIGFFDYDWKLNLSSKHRAADKS